MQITETNYFFQKSIEEAAALAAHNKATTTLNFNIFITHDALHLPYFQVKSSLKIMTLET